MALNLKCAAVFRAYVRVALFLVLALAGMPAEGAQVDDAAAIAMAQPQELIVAGDLEPAKRADLLKPVDAFYGFWINGSSALLDRALSPRFVDHTLPPGRPQGPTGPATASKAFLTAVPDLKMAVVQRLVVSDRVVSVASGQRNHLTALGEEKRHRPAR